MTTVTEVYAVYTDKNDERLFRLPSSGYPKKRRNYELIPIHISALNSNQSDESKKFKKAKFVCFYVKDIVSLGKLKAIYDKYRPPYLAFLIESKAPSYNPEGYKKANELENTIRQELSAKIQFPRIEKLPIWYGTQQWSWDKFLKDFINTELAQKRKKHIYLIAPQDCEKLVNHFKDMLQEVGISCYTAPPVNNMTLREQIRRGLHQTGAVIVLYYPTIHGKSYNDDEFHIPHPHLMFDCGFLYANHRNDKRVVYVQCHQDYPFFDYIRHIPHASAPIEIFSRNRVAEIRRLLQALIELKFEVDKSAASNALGYFSDDSIFC